MSLARVFCSWSIAAVLLLLSIAFSNSAESEKTLDPVVINGENGEGGNGTANVTMTGNPQIDYIHDPNLPRELNGYNLSDYPFYHRVPKNINFSCDGRKDGFYASIEHKCQIYHHCLFGSRYDFICANYTAFDQRTFICQFVSDVDCPNSHMFFHRNKDLYVTKSTTTAAPLYIDRDLYTRRRPAKKPKTRPRLVGEDNDNGDTDKQVETGKQSTTEAPASAGGDPPPSPKKPKDTEYAEEDYYEDDYEYPARRPSRPPRRRLRKCRNGRRRGRRCRPRRPPAYYYDDDYAYDDDYDYAYYDDVRPRKGGKRRRPLNAIPAGTSQVTSTSSSETPPPTTSTTTTTTEPPPPSSSELAAASGPLDSDSVAVLQKQRDELLKPRRNLRPAFRPSRQNDKSRTTSTTTTSTTTERVKPTTTTSTTTTTTTTEVPQYIYDYEYYEDDSIADQASSSSPLTTSTTTPKPQPFLRSGAKHRGGNSAAANLEKQRVQQSIQVRVTEDAGTNTNTIRRRDNSNVQTPTRVVAVVPATTSTTSTTPSSSTRARFWQRKSTVKSTSSISTTTARSTTSTTTTTTLAPYYVQDYQEYEDVEEDPQPQPPQPTAPAKPIPPRRPSQPPPRSTNRFQAIINTPQHQYGTSPAAALMQTYANTAPSASPHLQQQQSVTSSSRGHGSSSLSSSNYAPAPRLNKHYAMQTPQQYSQSSSSSSSISTNNNNRDSNYNTNSYHRQRSPSPPAPVVPKPEFISLVDEDYNNPYVSGPSAGSTSPSSTRYHGGGGGSVSGALGSPGYHHQHPIRYFEQHQPPSFLFGAASEYNNPQFAFPPRNYPSPSNFQPYGHNTRRFAPHMFK